MSNSRFSIIQAKAVYDERLSATQLRTLAALGCFGDKNGWCFPSLRTLGKKLNKPFQVVGRDIKRLVELGYLEKHVRFDGNGGRKSNLYRLKYDTPSPSASDTPSPSEGDTPSPSEGDTPSLSEGDTPSPSEGDTPSPSEGDITFHINDPINVPINVPINGDSPARPNFQKMTVQQACQQPTLKLYRDATGRLPGAATWEYVHETIRRHRLTEERIRAVFSEWVARGYNPDNIQGILNVVIHGWREAERPRADPSDPYRARDEHDRQVIERLAESMR